MVFFCDMDPLQPPPQSVTFVPKKMGFFLKASLNQQDEVF